MAEVHVRTWQVAYRHVFPAELLDSLSVERREAGWKREFGGETVAFVAEEAGSVIGFASAGPAAEEPGSGELYTIYVLPHAWGGGAAKALHDAAIRALVEAGFDVAVLTVLADNPRARRFYEREGWTADRARRAPHAGVEVDEVRYRRALGRLPQQA